ncbi:MAG: SDR family oxidoreductase [bacterium]|nr:SDR family oxidoreductase [bacterium]
MNDINETWAFVTGISEGVGKSMALRLAGEGYNVIGTSRKEPAYPLEQHGIHWFHSDLSGELSGDEPAAHLRKHTANLRVIVLNAAESHYGKIPEISHQHLERLMRTNFLSNIYLLQNLLPMMERGGQVIFVGSSAEYLPAPNMGIYAALKTAQSHLAATLNVECQHQGITFKVIRPQGIRTRLAEKFGVPTDKHHDKTGLTPDRVAMDILRLMKKNTYVLHAGWVSRLLFVFDKIGVAFCILFSKRRHKERV